MTAEQNGCGHPRGRDMAGAAIANRVVFCQSLRPRIRVSPESSVILDFLRLGAGRVFHGLYPGAQL